MSKILQSIKFEEKMITSEYMTFAMLTHPNFAPVSNQNWIKIHDKITIEIKKKKICKIYYWKTFMFSSLSSTSVAMVAQTTSNDRDHIKKQYLFA